MHALCVSVGVVGCIPASLYLAATPATLADDQP